MDNKISYNMNRQHYKVSEGLTAGIYYYVNDGSILTFKLVNVLMDNCYPYDILFYKQSGKFEFPKDFLRHSPANIYVTILDCDFDDISELFKPNNPNILFLNTDNEHIIKHGKLIEQIDPSIIVNIIKCVRGL